ncbi:helix-turn-helix domain-containing protein [Kribbella lupini]
MGGVPVFQPHAPRRGAQPVRVGGRVLSPRPRLTSKAGLWHTNLTVTEVSVMVGYSALGSFTRRFTELVGVSPSEYQRTQTGARIPGCYVFMLGLSSAIPAKPDRRQAPYGRSTDDTEERA